MRFQNKYDVILFYTILLLLVGFIFLSDFFVVFSTKYEFGIYIYSIHGIIRILFEKMLLYKQTI